MGMTIDNSIALLVDYLKWQKQQGMDGNGIDEATRNLIGVARKYKMMQIDHKADMVAMLEEISLEFDEQYHVNRHELHDDFLNRGLEQGQSIIQQKIDALKGEQA